MHEIYFKENLNCYPYVRCKLCTHQYECVDPFLQKSRSLGTCVLNEYLHIIERDVKQQTDNKIIQESELVQIISHKVACNGTS